MSQDTERVGAFLLLFTLANAPLLGMVALPPTGGWLLLSMGLSFLSWAGVGLFLAAVARTEIQPRGFVDGIWVATTLTPPVALLALTALTQTPGLPGSPWTPMAAMVTTFLLVAFWILYALGGDTGPVPLRRRREAMGAEDRATMGAIFLLAPGLAFGLAVAGIRPSDPALAAIFVGIPGVVIFGGQWLGGRRRRRTWSALGEALGFSEEENHLRHPDHVGAVDGRACRVRLERRHARHFDYWRTEVFLDLDDAPEAELHLQPEGRLSWIQKALGARDADLGRPGLDEDVLAGAQDPDLARRVVETAAQAGGSEGGFASTRRDLPAVWDDLAEVELSRGRLVGRLPGIPDQESAEEVLEVLSAMGDALEEVRRERVKADKW